MSQSLNLNICRVYYMQSSIPANFNICGNSISAEFNICKDQYLQFSIYGEIIFCRVNYLQCNACKVQYLWKFNICRALYPQSSIYGGINICQGLSQPYFPRSCMGTFPKFQVPNFSSLPPQIPTF